MTGTKAGFAKAKATMIAKWGEEGYLEHFRKMGAKGGAASSKGGFASLQVGADGLTGRERSVVCGRIGGRKSKRGKKVQNDENRVSESVNPGV